MTYRVYFHDPSSSSGYSTGMINDTVLRAVVNGTGQAFVQLIDRRGEVYAAVSSIFKIERKNEGEEPLVPGFAG